MRILSSLRATYLYAALTIAMGAIVVALIALFSAGLETAGLASVPPPADSIRERVSTGVAILFFAVPVGAVHLWLIVRSLADPVERLAGPRHFFLNAWMVAGLVMAVTSVTGITAIVIVERTPDVSVPVSLLFVGLAIALGAWRWREAIPGAARTWQAIAAYATCGLATIVGVIAVGSVMRSLSGLADHRGSFYPPAEAAWSGLIDLVAVTAVWVIGVRWQRAWRDLRFRTVFAAVGFGIGLAYFALAATDELARLLAVAGGTMDVAEVARWWGDPAMALYLVCLYLPWLLADRRRIALDAVVTDRLLAGIGSLVGLLLLALAWMAGWTFLAHDVLRLGPAVPAIEFGASNVGAGTEAVAALVLGLLLYVPSWWVFARATRSDVRSSLRRAYVLTVMVLSLLATIVTGVIAVSTAISLALGAQPADPLARTAIDMAGTALGPAVLLAAHAWLLLRDLRASRGFTVAVASVRPHIDPLVALLEEVAGGRLSPDAAAARIRNLLAPAAPKGRTA